MEFVNTVYAPNGRGVDRALAAGAKIIYMGTASNDQFLGKLAGGMTVEESLDIVREVMPRVREAGARMGVYASDTVSERRRTAEEHARYEDILRRLVDEGVSEFAVCDSKGTATKSRVREALDHTMSVVEPRQVVVHFHNRNNNAVRNSFVAVEEYKVTIVDGTLLALGGCPAVETDKGKGNMPIETFVAEAPSHGIETGIDMDRLMAASFYLAGLLGLAEDQIHSPAYHEYRAAHYAPF